MNDEPENESEPEVDVEAVLDELREKQSSTADSRQLRGIDDVSKMGITFEDAAEDPREITIDEMVELMQKIYEDAAQSDNIFYENGTKSGAGHHE